MPHRIAQRSIADWLSALAEQNILPPGRAAALLAQNETPGAAAEQYRLPLFAAYGPSSALAPLESEIPEEQRQAGSFFIRCTPLAPGLSRQRIMDTDWETAAAFISALPGGPERYSIRAYDYWKPQYSGTVVANGAGRLCLEIIRGDISDIHCAPGNRIRSLRLDQPGGDIHFQSETGISRRERAVLLGALRYFSPSLDRDDLGALSVYAEFAFRPGKGYRFRPDVSTDPFWTSL